MRPRSRSGVFIIIHAWGGLQEDHPRRDIPDIPEFPENPEIPELPRHPGTPENPEIPEFPIRKGRPSRPETFSTIAGRLWYRFSVFFKVASPERCDSQREWPNP